MGEGEGGELLLYEDELYGEKEAREATRQFVAFTLGDEWYGVDVALVREVVALPPISFVPNVPDTIAGVFNLRGNIVSVTDLKKVFGLSQSTTGSERGAGGEGGHSHGRVVVIESAGVATGLMIDSSGEAMEIPLSKIQPLVMTLQDDKGELMEGQAEMNGRLIALLDAKKLIERTRL